MKFWFPKTKNWCAWLELGKNWMLLMGDKKMPIVYYIMYNSLNGEYNMQFVRLLDSTIPIVLMALRLHLK